MPRSSLALLGAIAVSVVACGTTVAGVHSRDFAPGERAVHSQGLQVELIAAQYEERLLTLGVAVTNRTDDPATLQRQGLLLAYQELEFPVAYNPRLHVAPSIAVAPGQRVELWLPFETGTPVVEGAILRVRAAKAGRRPLEALALAIPASPSRPAEGPPDHSGSSP